MKHLSRWIILGVALLVFVLTFTRNLQRSAQKYAIYDAVLRYSTTSEGNSLNMNRIKNLFVDIEGNDPNPEFIKRFENSGITIRGASQAPSGGNLRSGSIFADPSGQPAVMVRFRGVSWKDSSHPTVSAGGYGFIMEKIGDTWNVQYQTLATF